MQSIIVQILLMYKKEAKFQPKNWWNLHLYASTIEHIISIIFTKFVQKLKLFVITIPQKIYVMA